MNTLNNHFVFSRLQYVVPFILSLVVLMFLHRYLGQSSPALVLDRSGILSVSSIIVLAGIVSLLPHRLQDCVQYLILGFAYILDLIEILLATHFDLSISPAVFQMLLETNSKEASEFVETYVLSSKTFSVLIYYLCTLLVIVLIYVFDKRFKNKLYFLWQNKCVGLLWGFVLLLSFLWQIYMFPYYSSLAGFLVSDKYQAMNWVITTHVKTGNIGYYPFLRLVYSLKSVQLMGLEKDLIESTNQDVKAYKKDVASDSPLLVFYLGESYVKRHSQHYGYPLATSPYTMKEKQAGRLFVFNDAITLKNSTSTVVRSVLSLNQSGQSLWNEVPLFPVLLRKSGYRTCFLTNQYVSQNNDVWNVAGGNFLTVPRIVNLLFDSKNPHSYSYDNELASLCMEEIEKQPKNLFVFFQGLGQHVAFSQRFPQEETYFTKEHYSSRKELSEEEKQLVSDYDNATRYVDKVMYRMMSRLNDKDAIMVYISDHGEEVLDETHKLGRQNSLDLDVIRSEYEVPMWIWCSEVYKQKHPDVVFRIQQAVDKPFSIDDIAHLMIGLAGVHCDDYNPERDILSLSYKIPSKRGIGFDGFQYNAFYEELLKTR